MAIGTAVKKMPGVSTHSPMLIPQAIIQDRDTFVNTAEGTLRTQLNQMAIIVICHLLRVRDSPLAPSFLKYLP